MTDADALYADALVWDQHSCLPLPRGGSVDELDLYATHGVDFVSINVGFDAVAWDESLRVATDFREQLLARPDRFALVETAQDVRDAKRAGQLAVAFDLEGADALDGRVSMVETYHRLGVRTMLIAYNLPNLAGGGCNGDPEDGLTGFGRAVVAEMNRVGMLVDATHCSRRTTLDLFEQSRTPVVFSHSVPLGVARHRRNVSDAQLRACAATGGVVGINGIGAFLGGEASAAALFRAVDYAVELIGPEHVGIGLDYVFDPEEARAYVTANPRFFPAGDGYADTAFAGPQELRPLTRLLVEHGYPEAAVRGILGENFLRVADVAWAADGDAGARVRPGATR